MIKKSILGILVALLSLAGCSTGEKDVLVNKESVDDVNEIVVNFASTDVDVQVSDTSELEAHLTVYDDGPGVTLDKSANRLTVDLESSIARLVKKKPTLELMIPQDFEGKLTLDGSSGNISGKDLNQTDIDVKASSGNVKLHFAELNGDVEVSTSSGKATIEFDEETPDLDLDVSTNSGSQSINMSLDESTKDKRKVKGTSGNGGNEMKIKTKSGSIKVN